ncbi:MAG: hypothetical protein IKM31_11205, partial [Oscillospiraceae bacterium]|nr:hypothetical protein [Oscillospiraceae bacterium]
MLFEEERDGFGNLLGLFEEKDFRWSIPGAGNFARTAGGEKMISLPAERERGEPGPPVKGLSGEERRLTADERLIRMEEKRVLFDGKRQMPEQAGAVLPTAAERAEVLSAAVSTRDDLPITEPERTGRAGTPCLPTVDELMDE